MTRLFLLRIGWLENRTGTVLGRPRIRGRREPGIKRAAHERDVGRHAGPNGVVGAREGQDALAEEERQLLVMASAEHEEF